MNAPITEQLTTLYQEYITRATNNEVNLIILINRKAEKLANDLLIKKEHTQLSYLPKERRELEVAIAKNAILDKFIGQLNNL
jgi:hypothetical protein